MAGTLEDKSIWEEEETLGEEVLRMPTDEIVSRTRLMDNEIKIMKSELMRITHELQTQNEKIKDNAEKIKVNKTLPYLVSNVIELLDVGELHVHFAHNLGQNPLKNAFSPFSPRTFTQM